MIKFKCRIFKHHTSYSISYFTVSCDSWHWSEQRVHLYFITSALFKGPVSKIWKESLWRRVKTGSWKKKGKTAPAGEVCLSFYLKCFTVSAVCNKHSSSVEICCFHRHTECSAEYIGSCLQWTVPVYLFVIETSHKEAGNDLEWKNQTLIGTKWEFQNWLLESGHCF